MKIIKIILLVSIYYLVILYYKTEDAHEHKPGYSKIYGNKLFKLKRVSIKNHKKGSEISGFLFLGTGSIIGKGETNEPVYIVWLEGVDGFTKRYDIPIDRVAFIEDGTLEVEASSQTWENGIHEIVHINWMPSSRVLIHLPKKTIIQKVSINFDKEE
ncbi:hypothetical protein LIL_50048 (plasmid) [Leptospira interrogans serovar Linhai str. 56609]|uniref:hypothetical protein n=1 Tax=Leptospira interrogans TaxID=173 RepID=UPI0002BFFAE6|nr:hypothetical protein [Leptospira interrogans]AJR16714.1 hypothetical protein LIL_50048 [Leptospira interrogans serovar Linhai str. 56609]EMJ55932.1 hypothetical protein LEP1GSC111_4215 [Leptospira interrogans str. UT126]